MKGDQIDREGWSVYLKYTTNIYMLYEDIIREYGDDWENEWTDIDLPFVISKKKNLENLCYKNDFTNIILVFDYERHDPQFSADKILRLQNYFSDANFRLIA